MIVALEIRVEAAVTSHLPGRCRDDGDRNAHAGRSATQCADIFCGIHKESGDLE
ncbi:hypothetical protein [Mesorhizobium sp.]|uniref:hypothetical protein n=1 Tax=Mesorhizobium sp. TaxID=1871066 RepID=UPI0025FACC81|nr:hypothetical protein [Mesorhizobium sp.]